MGYYTYYTLTVYEGLTDREVPDVAATEMGVVKALAKINPNYFDERDDVFTAISSDDMKWYDHDEDMIELSKIFPDYRFELEGEGEERNDNWIAYYYRGKSHTLEGQITYPEYDIRNLGYEE